MRGREERQLRAAPPASISVRPRSAWPTSSRTSAKVVPAATEVHSLRLASMLRVPALKAVSVSPGRARPSIGFPSPRRSDPGRPRVKPSRPPCRLRRSPPAGVPGRGLGISSIPPGGACADAGGHGPVPVRASPPARRMRRGVRGLERLRQSAQAAEPSCARAGAGAIACGSSSPPQPPRPHCSSCLGTSPHAPKPWMPAR
jgi:hypothetical protein